MTTKNLISVALRYGAVFLDINREEVNNSAIHNSGKGLVVSVPEMAFIARLKENGYSVSEELLHALSTVSTDRLAEITKYINDVMGVNLNWAPLVKGWDVPTGESLADHIITLVANFFGEEAGFKGTTLPCGHLIPEGTFPLERYNGCPFCGTQFNTSNFVYKGQASKLKMLNLFTLDDMRKLFGKLLASPTPLDATQRDSLEKLLDVFALPENPRITMKETAMLVTKTLAEKGRYDEAQVLMTSPADILRFLWYEKTGRVQIIKPKTLVEHAGKLYSHMWGSLDKSADASAEMKKKLMLKYDRKACMRTARWMNALPMTPQQAAEQMNPKRGMWVRMIRALRLGEYSRKKGFEHLAEILDVFYKQEYHTWQGNVDKAQRANDAETTLELLKQRPGLFARCLFATMLRFGSDKVIAAFEHVADKMPARLLISLSNAAEIYFDPESERIAHPVTGVTHRLEPNKMLSLYDKEELDKMVKAVGDVFSRSMARRFAEQKTESKTIFIDKQLYDIPVSVGNRSETIQDTSCALMGTRFPVEGDAVRLFLQWGKGLHAMHLDMDLSCRISLPDNIVVECAYYSLTCPGAKHSGDIRSTPEMVGTAEYIELSMPELEAAGAKYVTFTCNAYSVGALSPNLVVGWMNSAFPMQVSEETGVAYDPSCVQHMVRISQTNLSKGLVFGVLDVVKRQIIWLEMPFTSQNIKGADNKSVEALLRKLEARLSVGGLLEIKAKAQGLTIVENAEDADEKYDYEWAKMGDYGF
ncbi:MAG: hypothetical protein IKZ61_07330 [Prevotella sp.]|nr:hypothetical protein [Prevotella sp.]